MTTRPRYLMVGGFLGAGKTTSILAFAQWLDAQGLKVGLITNDQGVGLVDSALGRSKRYPVEEISGGCFCCKFNSLIEAAQHLTESNRPDVFLAEPVGSCTDLVATVCLPLQAIYGNDFVVAPLSVLIDPIRALRVFGLDEDGKRFSENVSYIYRKQLQEAEIIVINKLDLVDPEKLAQLREVLGREFPDAEVLEMSARTGAQLHDWFTRAMSGEMAAASVMEIDYKRYGEGEALLGWLNATIHVKAKADPDEFDGNTVLIHLAKALQVSMNERGYEVAHLKATLAPDDAPSEISAVNLVRSDGEPELSHHLVEPIEAGEILLNMRAEAPPEELEAATQRAIRLLIDELSIDFDLHHLQHFRPGQPTPTHRMTTAAN